MGGATAIQWLLLPSWGTTHLNSWMGVVEGWRWGDEGGAGEDPLVEAAAASLLLLLPLLAGVCAAVLVDARGWLLLLLAVAAGMSEVALLAVAAGMSEVALLGEEGAAVAAADVEALETSEPEWVAAPTAPAPSLNKVNLFCLRVGGGLEFGGSGVNLFCLRVL